MGPVAFVESRRPKVQPKLKFEPVPFHLKAQKVVEGNSPYRNGTSSRFKFPRKERTTLKRILKLEWESTIIMVIR